MPGHRFTGGGHPPPDPLSSITIRRAEALKADIARAQAAAQASRRRAAPEVQALQRELQRLLLRFPTLGEVLEEIKKLRAILAGGRSVQGGEMEAAQARLNALLGPDHPEPALAPPGDSVRRDES